MRTCTVKAVSLSIRFDFHIGQLGYARFHAFFDATQERLIDFVRQKRMMGLQIEAKNMKGEKKVKERGVVGERRRSLLLFRSRSALFLCSAEWHRVARHLHANLPFLTDSL